MRRLVAAALIGLSGWAAGPLAAQTIWRCGPDARQFQATPCEGGTLVALKPGPTPEAVAEARAVAARERVALQTLSAQRQARERDAVAGPSGISRTPTDNARKADAPKDGKKTGRNSGQGRKPVRPSSSASTGPEA